MNIERLTYEQVLMVWESELWRDRLDPIESRSAMRLNGGYDPSYMDSEAVFLGVMDGGFIVGVNSGHATGNRLWRSRGLYVSGPYRGRGLGRKLLEATADHARDRGAKMIWSFPRQTSLRTYTGAGYTVCSHSYESDTSDANYYAIRPLRSFDDLVEESLRIDALRLEYLEENPVQTTSGREMLEARRKMSDDLTEQERAIWS